MPYLNGFQSINFFLIAWIFALRAKKCTKWSGYGIYLLLCVFLCVIECVGWHGTPLMLQKLKKYVKVAEKLFE